jgi:hypothetical protein
MKSIFVETGEEMQSGGAVIGWQVSHSVVGTARVPNSSNISTFCEKGCAPKSGLASAPVGMSYLRFASWADAGPIDVINAQLAKATPASFWTVYISKPATQGYRN